MVNFYRRFIPAVANILLPLTDALRADLSWIWAPAMQHNFQLVKDTLAEVATLTHPDPAADLRLAVDASSTYIERSYSSGSQAVAAAFLFQQEARRRPAEILCI
jgi:hypothetical protein